MNDRMYAGVAVLSACFVAAALAVRRAVIPVRETGPYDDDHDTVVTPIAGLMGEWEPVYGVALERASRGCPCGGCLTPSGAEAAS